jgi:hypothetical protein
MQNEFNKQFSSPKNGDLPKNGNKSNVSFSKNESIY